MAIPHLLLLSWMGENADGKMHHHSCDHVVDGHLTSLLDRLNSAETLDDETQLDTPSKTQATDPECPETDNNETDVVESDPDTDPSDDVNSVLPWSGRMQW